jgi:hypothetical protein
VTLTDLEQVLPILRTNVRANLGGQQNSSNKHKVLHCSSYHTVLTQNLYISLQMHCIVATI